MLQNPNDVDVLIRLIHEAFGAGDLSVIDELLAPDFVEHQFGVQGRGPEAITHVKAAILDLRRWLPDLTFTIEDTACVNGTAWVRATASGTNEGSVMGAEPTHQPVTVNVIDIARIVHGRIVEHWGVPDRFALLAQVGVLRQLDPTTPGPRQPSLNSLPRQTR
jgi:predicted ester cyclase